MAETLKFYCFKDKVVVKTDKYMIKKKSGKRFAIATHNCGTKMWRIVGKA